MTPQRIVRVLLLTMAMLFAGCSSDEEPPDPVPEPVDASVDHPADATSDHAATSESRDAGVDGDG